MEFTTCKASALLAFFYFWSPSRERNGMSKLYGSKASVKTGAVLSARGHVGCQVSEGAQVKIAQMEGKGYSTELGSWLVAWGGHTHKHE